MYLVNDQLIAEMVDTIIAEVMPDRIYLFSSRAKGLASATSDVDLLLMDPRNRRVDQEPCAPDLPV